MKKNYQKGGKPTAADSARMQLNTTRDSIRMEDNARAIAKREAAFVAAKKKVQKAKDAAQQRRDAATIRRLKAAEAELKRAAAVRARDASGSRKDSKTASPNNPKPGPYEYQKGGITKKAPATIPQQNGNDSYTRSIVRDIVHTKPGTRRNKADEMNQQRIKDRSLKMQKGGKVKNSLRYKPGYPTTQNKPSPHSKLKLDTAIARDSTSISNRGIIGDFFDDGAENSTSRKLQVNREYRDKVNNSNSNVTAKKINTVKNKKQMGGRLQSIGKGTGRAPMTGQQTKDLGKTLKKKGRKMKRGERRDKMNKELDKTQGWLQSGGSKEITFGAPKKKQKGGSFFESDAERKERLSRMGDDYQKKLAKENKKEKAAVAKAKNDKTNASKAAASAKSAGATWRTAVGAERPSGGDKEAKMKLAIAKDQKVNYNRSKPDYALRHENRVYTNPNSKYADQEYKDELKQKGGMKYGKGGMKNKKFLGGLMGAIKGAKGGGGLMGGIKGALGGGMLGRSIGALKGAVGGGGLKGALAGFKGGAFDSQNANALAGGAQQAAPQAQAGQQVAAAQAAAAQDPALAQQGVAQRGGIRDRRKARRTERGKELMAKGRKSDNSAYYAKNPKQAARRVDRGNKLMRRGIKKQGYDISTKAKDRPTSKAFMRTIERKERKAKRKGYY